MSDMHAYEFSAQISDPGQVTIPSKVARQLPPGASVRVIILVDDVETSANGYGEQGDSFLPSLEDLIAEIKRTPSKPENIRPGSGLLADHLANPVAEPDPDFDEVAWNHYRFGLCPNPCTTHDKSLLMVETMVVQAASLHYDWITGKHAP